MRTIFLFNFFHLDSKVLKKKKIIKINASNHNNPVPFITGNILSKILVYFAAVKFSVKLRSPVTSGEKSKTILILH
jgi:hypothetical protein